jgi:hypothetical protein
VAAVKILQVSKKAKSNSMKMRQHTIVQWDFKGVFKPIPTEIKLATLFSVELNKLV